MRIAHFLSLLLGLAACAPEDPALRQGDPPDRGRCMQAQNLSSGALYGVWRSPSGTTWALSNASALRVRAPDGSWSEEPEEPALAFGARIHGADDDSVWVVTGFGALRRLADGTWEDMGAPADFLELVTLHVRAADDVVILRVIDENKGCSGCQTRLTPSLLRWDGAAWTEEVYPTIEDVIRDMAVLPDGRVVLAMEGGLRTLGVDGHEVPVPEDLWVQRVVAGADGTLVAFASSRVAIGSADEGLSPADPDVPGVYWHDAWVGGADDVWLSGVRVGADKTRNATIVHWDGEAWAVVLSDYSAAPFAIAGGGGELVAVGGGEREVALAGDAGGLTVERDQALPGGGVDLAVDDVTGEARTVGGSPVLGVYREGRWQGIPLADRTPKPSRIAASAGRVVLSEMHAGLHVLDGGTLTFTPDPPPYHTGLSPLVGAEGVFFSAARWASADPPFVLLREAGEGWQPISTDGLPAGILVSSLWADDAWSLWMGFQPRDGDGGGLARWDGEGWTVVVDDLRTAPADLVRGGDGHLYFVQFEGSGVGDETLWTFDGERAAPVPETPPDVRAAYRTPDGALFVAAVVPKVESTGVESAIMRREPGEDWVDVTRGLGIPKLAGLGDTVWATKGVESYTFGPCP